MQQQTLEQRRSQHAWKTVQQIKQLSKKESKDLAGHAKKMPMRIKAAGLGQALAFLDAKLNQNGHINVLHQALSDWVIQERKICGEKTESLIISVINGTSDTLRRSTDEVLSWLEWFNRFAEAEGLKDE